MTKMTSHPDYLYHYTTIDNLALILKSRAIRFSRLDKVNDPEEALTKQFPAAKYFIYASCWTAEEKESLPLWSIYSYDMKGVRLRLPSNMFKGRNRPEYETTGYPIIHAESALNIKRKNITYSALLNGPMPIQYLDDPMNDKNCFQEKESGILNVDLLHLGLEKSDYWHFEKEWRYRVIGMPFEGSWRTEDFNQFMEFPTSEYVDIFLDKSVFSELVVQLGPKSTHANSIMVELLLKEFAPGAKLCDSSCKVKRNSL